MGGRREHSRRWSGRFPVVILVLGAAGMRAEAFTLESLVMPGPVVEAHSRYEDDCGSCHVDTEEESQEARCVVCHTAVGSDVLESTGFHGRHPDARNSECASCHTDHEGRDADVVGLDRGSFDHSFTDFSLGGAHEALLCSDCHVPETPWAGAPGTCLGCHAHDDVHEGQMQGSCAGCHNATAWQDATFDHDTTQFPLHGEHTSVGCGGCHQEQVFHGIPTDCVSCHAEDDVHLGRNGARCESCHSPTAWSATEFDHVEMTGFPLLGAHASAGCEACHVQDLATAVSTACQGCHGSQDVHQGGLGTDCGSCHTVAAWSRTRFDHSQVDGFPLVGAHQALECSACHVGGGDARLPLDCSGCHSGDPHQGQLGSGCEACHSESAWTREVRFDHGLARFPLIGAHQSVGCESCHETPAFHDAAEDCRSCHAADDAHDGRLGFRCGTCHTPTQWEFWRFEHDTQTQFPLTGAHFGAACAACHREPSRETVSAPTVCEQCHRRDDPHLGRFGADCGECHTTDSFSDLRGF